MSLIFGTMVRDDVTLSAVCVETAEDMHALRDEHADWHEGALSILTYPTARPEGFLSHNPPKSFGTIRFLPGATLTKDAAGNFGFCYREELIPNA